MLADPGDTRGRHRGHPRSRAYQSSHATSTAKCTLRTMGTTRPRSSLPTRCCSSSQSRHARRARHGSATPRFPSARDPSPDLSSSSGSCGCGCPRASPPGIDSARSRMALVRARSLDSSTACRAAAQNGAAAATINATSQRGSMVHAEHATPWLCHSLNARASSIAMTAESEPCAYVANGHARRAQASAARRASRRRDGTQSTRDRNP